LKAEKEEESPQTTDFIGLDNSGMADDKKSHKIS